MAHAPVRFEEIGFNYGFVPININSKKGYNVVYHLFMDRMLEDGRLVLIKGNENKIMLKDIEGPVEDREKVIIYSPDITNFYKFNLTNKLVGFGIEAYRRSKTGYWFLAFQREGQLQAFCDFLNWVIYGKLPRRRAVQPAYHPAYRPVSRGRYPVRQSQASSRTRYYSQEPCNCRNCAMRRNRSSSCAAQRTRPYYY